MARGSLGTHWPDREAPLSPFHNMMEDVERETVGENFGPDPPRMFADAAQEYMDRYGAEVRHLAKIGEHILRR